MEDKINWCFKIKEGLRFKEPNERLSKSYLEHAKSSLLRAEKNFKDKDFLWTTVAIYYAEYYALYSFLQKIGIKCGNHTCSILAVESMLGEKIVKTIKEHKDKRVDAQYYMKIGQESKIKLMLNESKLFISYFDELISNLSEKESEEYLNKLKDIIK